MTGKPNKIPKKGQSNQVAPIALESLPPDLREIIDALPADKRGDAVRTFTQISISAHRGPIPAPETLARYNNILEGSADRIIKMAENQQNHRFEIEKTSIRRQYNQSSTGQWMGMVITLSFLAASVYLGINDHDVLAGALGGTTLVALVTLFVAGKINIGKSLKEKE